jgi:hypothetical protein
MMRLLDRLAKWNRKFITDLNKVKRQSVENKKYSSCVTSGIYFVKTKTASVAR